MNQLCIIKFPVEDVVYSSAIPGTLESGLGGVVICWGGRLKHGHDCENMTDRVHVPRRAWRPASDTDEGMQLTIVLGK